MSSVPQVSIPFTATDIHGAPLKAGYAITTSLVKGECTVQEVLSPFAVRLRDAAGKRYDVSIKLGKVACVERKDPKARTTTQRYGV